MNLFNEQMHLFHDNLVINWHEHVRESSPGVLDEDCDQLVAAANATGVDKLLCSIPFTDPHCPPEVFKRGNDVVAQAMKRHPEKILGMCFVNPGYCVEALAEIERCVTELGMIGVKLYHQYFIDDPIQFPLIEKCIELDIPILMHAGMVCDPACRRAEPRLSHGVHFANIGKRYPQARFIMAHIGGGGDWQGSLKPIKDVPNVFIDMSGSVYDTPIIEESVRILGADRILFGTDLSFASCIGKMLGAKISDAEKRTILEGTAFLCYLERGCKQ